MEFDKEIEEMHEHHKVERVGYSEKGRFFVVRNILNIIFILFAIAGMVTYLLVSETIGGIILVASVFFKLAECMLRLLH